MVAPKRVSKEEFRKFPGVRWNGMNDICALSEQRDLNPVQTVAYRAYWYMSEVENGGHFQYFVNRMDFDHQVVLKALRDIGAAEHAAILESALSKVAAGAKLELPRTVKDYLASEDERDLSEFDEAFFACNKSINDFLEDYLDRYESDFIEWVP